MAINLLTHNYLNIDIMKIVVNISAFDAFIMMKFLTTWCLIFIAFHHLVYKHIDILFLSAIVCIIGLYASHVKPKRFVLKLTNQTIYVEGLFKLLTADLLHVAMFAFAVKYYGKYYLQCSNQWLPLTNTIMLIWLYLLIIQPDQLYEINEKDIAIVFAVATTLYLSVMILLRT